jgi:hypothetical protein
MAREMSPDTLVADSDGVFGLATASHDMSDVVMAGAGNGIGGAFDMGCYARDQVQKHGKPCVVHEFGYPESFPNTADIPRYDQNLRPFWLRHTLEKARAAGAERLLPLYVENSRKLHFQIVRRAIEDMRTVDGLGGYGHWGFMDFVHESIGLVDVFLGDKAGSAEAFARSNGPVALSVKPDCGRMTGFAGQDYGFAVYLSSHGAAGRAGARALRCSLEIGGVAVSECAAEIELRDFGVARAEGLALRAPAADLPCHATLRAEAPGVAENSWDVWLFPRRQPPSGEGVVYLKDSWQTLNRLEALLPGCRGVAEAALWKRPPADVLVTAVLSGAVSDYLRRGGKVVLLPMYYANSSNGLPMLPSSFAPAPSFAGTQGACGTVVSEHPCLDGFPHQGWCDYQFYDLLSGQRMPPESVPFHNPGVQAFDLTPWPSGLEPIIRSIPNWKTCANRAYMFECRVGEGRLLACSLRVLETATLNPESAWLLGGIADYARGGSFAPKSHIGHADFEKLRAEASYTRL